MCSARLDTLMHGAAAVAAREGKDDDDDDDAEEFICSTYDWWIYWSGLWRVFLYDTHTHAKSEQRRIYTGRVSNAQRYDITVACVYIIPPNNNIIIYLIRYRRLQNIISRAFPIHICVLYYVTRRRRQVSRQWCVGNIRVLIVFLMHILYYTIRIYG